MPKPDSARRRRGASVVLGLAGAALVAVAPARAADPQAEVVSFNELIGPGVELPALTVIERATAVLDRLLASVPGGAKTDLYELRIADGFRIAERARAEGKWSGAWERFFGALTRLDLAQYKRNRFVERPTTRWIREFTADFEGRSAQVDKGWIAREEGQACIDAAGEEVDDPPCTEIRYAAYYMRIPNVPPLRAHQAGRGIGDEYLSEHTAEAFEVALGGGVEPITRTHRTIEHMFGSGYMELYRVYEKLEPDYVFVREENARSGFFVHSSDAAIKITADGRGGSYYAMVLTADTIFDSSLLRQKRISDTVKALTIYRQYIRLKEQAKGPTALVRAAVEAGKREFDEMQRTPPTNLVNFFSAMFD